MPDDGIETLYGPFDEHLRSLEAALDVRLKTQGSDLIIEGDTSRVDRAERVVDQLAKLLVAGYRFGRGDVKTAAQLLTQNPNLELQEYFRSILRPPSPTPRRPSPPSSAPRRWSRVRRCPC